MKKTWLVLLVACGPSMQAAPTAEPVQWHEWSEAAFESAAREERYLLVSVQAGWCHWCHVMNDETFGDPKVRRVLADHFVAIKVDSDARPDLAERFRNYAWPATALFTPDARLVIALRGYRPPDVLATLLEQVANGRRPRVAPPTTSGPVEDLEAALTEARSSLDALYDDEAHGWGDRQKYPYGAPLEHAFLRTQRHETMWRERALASAEAYARLIDSIDGGAFQYSLRGDWDHPHFEKIAAVQADVLLAMAHALAETGEPTWRERARSIVGYLRAQLRAPSGAFYTSQDADLSHEVSGTQYYALSAGERRELGSPPVDENIYTGLNGRLIVALAELDIADPTLGALEDAERAFAAIWDLQERGGYKRGHAPDPLRYLDDQAWMLRASLALAELTGNGGYREQAVATADWILEHLEHQDGGFYAHTEDRAARGDLARRRIPLRENGVAVRGLLRLHRVTKEDRYRQAALRSLRAVAHSNEIRQAGRRVGELLMALEELQAPYVLISVVGPDTADTSALQRAALRVRAPNRLVELNRPGASRYPYPGEPAAYLCNADACSIPITDPDALADATLSFLSQSSPH